MFEASLGDYDSLSVSIARDGTNLTKSTGEGEVVSNGHGLRGHLRARRGGSAAAAAAAVVGGDFCVNATNHDAEAEITTLSLNESVSMFCSDEASVVSVAVVAADKFGPFPLPGAVNSIGMVGPEGVPLEADPRAVYKVHERQPPPPPNTPPLLPPP